MRIWSEEENPFREKHDQSRGRDTINEGGVSH